MTLPSSGLSPFAFRPNEKVDQGFVRVLEELAIHARLSAQNAHGTLPESVHDTRVSIKRLRALLWFAGPVLSLSELNRLKSNLRNASHLLAAQRDLVVMRSILEKLSRKTLNSSDRATLVRIAHARDGEQAITGKPGQSVRQAVAILLTTIEELARKAKSRPRWPSSSVFLRTAGPSFSRHQKSW
jgi:CHAD domain-containing protein